MDVNDPSCVAREEGLNRQNSWGGVDGGDEVRSMQCGGVSMYVCGSICTCVSNNRGMCVIH